MARNGDGIRIGVIGCGYWGPKHLRVLEGLPGVTAAVAIDTRVERLAEVARTFPSAHCCRTLDEALPLIDALIVATPPSTHYPIAAAALEAGKHVLIEKPMATTAAEAELLLAAAREHSAGPVLMVGHTFEYNPAVRKLRELVGGGALGDIYYIDSARLNLGLYQSDVNVLLDLAPHDVSIMNYILGGEPTSVRAWGSQHAHPVHTDVAYLQLDYEELGCRAHIHVSWLDPRKVRRVTVVGSRKMAVYDDLDADERLRIYDKGVVRGVGGAEGSTGQPPMSYRYGDIVAPLLSDAEPLAVQDAHFVDCIRDGLAPQSDGHVGLSVIKVLDAAQLSLEHGGSVRLDQLAGTPRSARPGERGDAGPGLPSRAEPLERVGAVHRHGARTHERPRERSA